MTPKGGEGEREGSPDQGDTQVPPFGTFGGSVS